VIITWSTGVDSSSKNRWRRAKISHVEGSTPQRAELERRMLEALRIAAR